jgi:threonine dehydratase
MKLVIEPSAGVGVAAVLTDEFRGLAGIRKVGVVLCGGNVSLDKLYW